MKKDKKLRVGAACHVGCVLLAIVLALCVAGSLMLNAATRIFTDRKLMSEVTASTQTAQQTRVSDAVLAQAAEYGFDAETVKIDADAIAAYNAQVIDWWMQLTDENAQIDPPQWDADDLVEQIRADEGFVNTVEPTMRRIAAENVGYAIQQAIQDAAIPVRVPLIKAGLSMARERLNLGAMTGLVKLLYVPCVLLAMIAALLIVASMGRCMTRSLAYIGSGLLAGGVFTGLLMLVVNWLDVAAQAAQVSVVLSQEVAALGSRLAMPMAIAAGLCVLVGAALVEVHQYRMSVLRGRLE